MAFALSFFIAATAFSSKAFASSAVAYWPMGHPPIYHIRLTTPPVSFYRRQRLGAIARVDCLEFVLWPRVPNSVRIRCAKCQAVAFGQAVATGGRAGEARGP